MSKASFVFTFFLSVLATFHYFSWKERSDFEKEMKDKYGMVCITRTGEKYHACYHYSGRNSPISLYQAIEQGYDNCSVCKSPSEVDFTKENGYPNWFYRHYLFSSFVIGLIGFIAFVRSIK